MRDKSAASGKERWRSAKPKILYDIDTRTEFNLAIFYLDSVRFLADKNVTLRINI